jgi:ADP-ribose pyrophosphatase YjhB (NUDIX family)
MSKAKKRTRPTPRKSASRPSRPTRPIYTPTKEVSVMAWVEDAYGNVLLVRQARGKKLWTLPGGKVRPSEPLLSALRREVAEETGLTITHAAPVDVYDRPKKRNITLLYRVLLKPARFKSIRTPEISSIAFKPKLPTNASPSALFFWDRAQESFEPLSLLRSL